MGGRRRPTPKPEGRVTNTVTRPEGGAWVYTRHADGSVTRALVEDVPPEE